MTGCIIVYIPFVLYEISQPIIQKRHHRNIFRLLTSSFYLSSMKNIHPSLTLQTFAFFSVPFLELYSFLLKLCSTIPCKKSLKSILQFLFSPFVIILYLSQYPLISKLTFINFREVMFFSFAIFPTAIRLTFGKNTSMTFVPFL